MYVFTSAAANYLPKVAQLYQSVKKYIPEATFVLLANERPGVIGDFTGVAYDEIVLISDFEIGRSPVWTFNHNIVELSTAIKPFMVVELLKRPGGRSVTYLDPDIVVFSDIAEAIKFRPGENAILTPHLCKPESEMQGILDHETCALRHGLYNLGFISVNNTPEGLRLAQWWGDRTRDLCRADIPAGIFTDQKWMDFAPIFFEGVRVERSPRFNVAPWNIGQRRITKKGDTILVDGEPLGFYHFTGWDSGAHEGVLAHYAKASPDVWDLVRIYKAEAASFVDKFPLPPWSYATFSNGVKITDAHRNIYRARPDLQTVFPDPYAVDESGATGSYFDWFRTQGLIEYPSLVQPVVDKLT